MKSEFSENREEAVQTVGQDQRYKSTRLVCWLVCVGFALVEAWSQRQFITEDGVSYLDMSDWLLRHNWHLLVNPIWSPLYPLMIGVVTRITRPSAQWEVPTVHILNLIIFLGALASFEFLLRRVIYVLGRENGRGDANSAAPLPAWTWQLLGYSIFAWSTVGMIWGPRYESPDVCVATLVYLDGGLLLSLRAGAKRSRTCLLLGLTLGLGYLAKAILFPMAFVLMVVAFFMIGEWRKAVRPLAITSLVFCGVSAPLFISMSRRVGRLSYSEVGNLNYAWHVNGAPGRKAAGGPFFLPALGPPPYLKHPVTLLHMRPDAYGFREPLALTDAPQQDPEYWSAGTKADVNLPDQLRAIGRNLRVLFADGHILPMWGLICGGLLYVFLTHNALWRLKIILRSWPLLVPGIVAPGLYLLVYTESRLVAPFLVLVLLGLFPGILLQNPNGAAKRTAIATVVIAASVMVLTALLVVYHLAGFPRSEPSHGGLYLLVGKSLNRAGVLPGEEVAIIGDVSDGSRWARLGRVRIVAQIHREDAHDFWVSDPRVKAEVYDAFAGFGAKAVVAGNDMSDPRFPGNTPPPNEMAEWQRLGDSHYYVHLLALSGSK
jgi:hypothetical protein